MLHQVERARQEAAQAEAKGETLAEQLAAAQAREARIEEREAAWRDTHTEGTAKSLALQAEVARLGIESERLQRQRDEASAAAEERKQQALAAHRELQRLRSAAAAEEQTRLREQLRDEQQAHAQLQLRREAESTQAALHAEAAELGQLKQRLAGLEEQHLKQQANPLQLPQPPPHMPHMAVHRAALGAAADAVHAPPRARGLPPPGAEGGAGGAPAGGDAAQEVARLRALCSDFLQSGVYSAHDRVVLLLQEKIAQLQPAAGAASGAAIAAS